jgi:hypothetical protein
MSFCWFTSSIGYPNFFNQQSDAYELAKVFFKFSEASLSGKSYSQAKSLFTDIGYHQVETKKAAFQEYGLLYVVPSSDNITLTPLGHQIHDMCSDPKVGLENRRTVLLALSRALSRYQFNNPFPVGGNRHKKEMQSSDVLPYLSCYYLMLKLDGIITTSEIRGALFGLQYMSDLRKLESSIQSHRKSGHRFTDLPNLPSDPRTADNRKIYFISHLSLDNELMKATTANLYGQVEQAYEVTESGLGIIESVLDEQWPEWQSGASVAPRAREYKSIEQYFSEGVGQVCPLNVIEADAMTMRKRDVLISEYVLDQDEIAGLQELKGLAFEEGKQRLVQHKRLEKTRNKALVREAKRLFKLKYGRLFCEACDFDFEKKYGSRGKDYVEAHHKVPISTLEEPVINTTDEIAMICSNCHRMLHIPPWITLDELRSIIESEKSRTLQ